MELTPCGQTSTHLPQPVHLAGFTASWGRGASPKGLLHHRQRRGQPLKKMMVRMPGPSVFRNRPMSKMMAVFSACIGTPLLPISTRFHGTLRKILAAAAAKTTFHP